MKTRFLSFLVIAFSLSSLTAFCQTDSSKGELGLPGDNLDLYAVLDIFQKSKTIEDFEKTLNDENTKVNNLDLNDDKKVDFIKVETKKDGEDFTFILRDAISKSETQDVAVILVSKDNNKKVTMQIVGDKDLYGKDYIVEPSTSGNSTVTANPAYTGAEPVTVNVTAPTTTVIVEQVPIVQYVYSPAYIPYYPPYYYGFYPPYFTFFSVMAVGIYRSNHFYYHGGGYGYHHTTVIVNHNHYNNYHNSYRNTSNRVSHNNINSRNNNIGTNNRNTVSTRDNKVSSRNTSRTSASTRNASSSRPSVSKSMSTPRSSGASLNRGSAGGGMRTGGGGRRR
ncbi:hypothetical protein MCETHM1_00162 [Flavobacteriaceae bacterium]